MPSSGESEEPNANSSRPFLCGVVEVRSKILANLIILKGPSEGFATLIPCDEIFCQVFKPIYTEGRRH